MIGDAVVIGLGLLGFWWMLPPKSYFTQSDTNNSIRQGNGATSNPTPPVLQPSKPKTSMKHKVRVTLYKL
jgi:hypothetical protein